MNILSALYAASWEYNPGNPECGFLFPAFTDRCGDLNHIDVFQADADRPHDEILELLGVHLF